MVYFFNYTIIISVLLVSLHYVIENYNQIYSHEWFYLYVPDCVILTISYFCWINGLKTAD